MKIRFKNGGGYLLSDGIKGYIVDANLLMGVYYVKGKELNKLLDSDFFGENTIFDSESWYPFYEKDVENLEPDKQDRVKAEKLKFFANMLKKWK